MILFGESLNVISTVIGKAYRERDPKPIQEECLEQVKLGMDYIDINLGPAKKDGHELMPWVVQVVQEVVPDVPLLLDTSNIAAIEEGLKVCKPASKPHIVNSIMARPERYTEMLPIAAKYEADIVALMWGPDGYHEMKMNEQLLLLNYSMLPMKLAFLMRKSGLMESLLL
jgi:5-methyltetrahydrofolate corrinoid/iron sulfur protein methyltransferase